VIKERIDRGGIREQENIDHIEYWSYKLEIKVI